MAWTSPSLRSSSWAICRFDRLRPMKYRHSTSLGRRGPRLPQRLVMAGQHRAGQVVEARLAALAQPALARVPGILPAVPDHVRAVAGRAPHAIRPAMLADQVEALGVVEQRGQADRSEVMGPSRQRGIDPTIDWSPPPSSPKTRYEPLSLQLISNNGSILLKMESAVTATRADVWNTNNCLNLIS